MWSNESQEEFCSRLPCFVDQYNQYTFEGVPVIKFYGSIVAVLNWQSNSC